jgi:hypothetical protein
MKGCTPDATVLSTRQKFESDNITGKHYTPLLPTRAREIGSVVPTLFNSFPRLMIRSGLVIKADLLSDVGNHFADFPSASTKETSNIFGLPWLRTQMMGATWPVGSIIEKPDFVVFWVRSLLERMG